jgi:hypothetical protein
MLNTLLKPKKPKAPPPPHPNTQAITTLEQQVAEAQEAIATTQKYCNSCFLEAEEGGEKAKQKADAARGKLAEAHAKLDSLTGALLAARQREADRVTDEANTANSAAWVTAEKIGKEYVTLAVQMETNLINLSDQYAELTRLSDDFLRTVPLRSGRIRNAGFGPAQIEQSFRLFMHKLRWQWSASYPYNKDDIKPFSDTVKASVKIVMAMKPEAIK